MLKLPPVTVEDVDIKFIAYNYTIINSNSCRISPAISENFQ